MFAGTVLEFLGFQVKTGNIGFVMGSSLSQSRESFFDPSRVLIIEEVN